MKYLKNLSLVNKAELLIGSLFCIGGIIGSIVSLDLFPYMLIPVVLGSLLISDSQI